MGQNDEELILEYQAGHQKAVEVLYERYKNPILNFSIRILGHRADAEDVTGEVFLALVSEKYTPNSQAKFSTWLYTVARNSCLSRLRKKKNLVSVWFTSKKSGETEEWDILDSNSDFRENLRLKESSLQIKHALEKLPMEQKEAIVLREYQNLTYEEIAQILNCSLEKVKILIFRARENLRVALTPLMKGDLR